MIDHALTVADGPAACKWLRVTDAKAFRNRISCQPRQI
jgi:hypothetical protein